MDFAAAHRSDEDSRACISASRHVLSFIAKAKTEAWQATSSSLLNQCIFSFILLVVLLPLLTFPTALLPGSRHRYTIISFAITDLARLGVKPRLSRSSLRISASTHPLMVFPTSPREVLFACPPSPPWSPPFFTVKMTLFYAPALTLLFFDKVRLSLILTFSHLTM